MVERNNGYVYDSLARKLERNVYEENPVLKNKAIKRNHTKIKFKIFLYITVVLFLSSLTMYRYVQITDLGYKIKSKEAVLNALINENTSEKIKIEESINLNNIKTLAEQRLGMHTPYKYQTMYVRVPKNDFIEIEDGLIQN